MEKLTIILAKSITGSELQQLGFIVIHPTAAQRTRMATLSMALTRQLPLKLVPNCKAEKRGRGIESLDASARRTRGTMEKINQRLISVTGESITFGGAVW